MQWLVIGNNSKLYSKSNFYLGKIFTRGARVNFVFIQTDALFTEIFGQSEFTIFAWFVDTLLKNIPSCGESTVVVYGPHEDINQRKWMNNRKYQSLGTFLWNNRCFLENSARSFRNHSLNFYFSLVLRPISPTRQGSSHHVTFYTILWLLDQFQVTSVPSKEFCF